MSDFRNLERLDLRLNNLTSLDGLKSCVNLKWLSVVQNKLQTLKGIEGLSKLTVLNAGKNKLKSMDEVKYLVNLRALILNDNEIVSMCRLDQLKDLNTIVLSRNPIREIGGSLAEVKHVTKISLSNCQIQTIDSSLKSCAELKELRLAHNEIKALPAELVYNKRLQTLDLGNNVITRWSDLKVLESLVNLSNLNLQGNPVADKDNITKKVRKLIPNLHIFNTRPIDKSKKNEKSDRCDAAAKLVVNEEVKRDNTIEDDYKHHVADKNKEKFPNDAGDFDVGKELKRKKKKNVELLKKERLHEDDGKAVGKKPKRKRSKAEQGELDVIDDGETPFMDLFTSDKNQVDDGEKVLNRNADFEGGSVTYPTKKKKTKNRHMGALKMSPEIKVGLGGPSTWDN